MPLRAAGLGGGGGRRQGRQALGGVRQGRGPGVSGVEGAAAMLVPRLLVRVYVYVRVCVPSLWRPISGGRARWSGFENHLSGLQHATAGGAGAHGPGSPGRSIERRSGAGAGGCAPRREAGSVDQAGGVARSVSVAIVCGRSLRELSRDESGVFTLEVLERPPRGVLLQVVRAPPRVALRVRLGLPSDEENCLFESVAGLPAGPSG
jgi:hypothetical protein